MKKLYLKILFPIIFLAFFGWADSSWAAIYYVDYENGSDANDGLSTASPWKHVPGDSRFACAISCGYVGANGPETFIFKGGVEYLATSPSDYLINVTHSGSGNGSERVYDGNSEGAFGTGKAMINLNGIHYNAFYSSVKNYVKVRNFDIYGMKNAARSTDFGGDLLCAPGLYRVFRDGQDQCVAYDGSGTARVGAVFVLGGNNLEITNNTIHNSQDYADLCVYKPESDGYASSISSVPSDQCGIQITNNGGANPVSDITISHNEIYNIGRDAISLLGVTGPLVTDNDIGGQAGQGYFSVGVRVGGATTGLVMTGNKIHDGWQYQGDDADLRCHAGDWIHVYGNNNGANDVAVDPNDLLIEKNYFYSDKDFYHGNGTGVVFIEEDAFNIDFRNNLVVNPFRGIMTQNSANQLYFYNNTMISRHNTFPLLYIGMNTGSGVELKNNIFISYAESNSIPIVYVYDASDVPTAGNNVYWKPNESTSIIRRGATNYTLDSWRSFSAQEVGSLSGNPSLVDIALTGSITSSGDYSLMSNSIAIGAATDLSASFLDDYNGAVRTAAWDIGAYEYHGDSMAPSAPSGLSVQ